MKTIKFKKLNGEFVNKNYPILYNTIWNKFNEIETEEQREKIAGLCLEVALQADGTINIFLEEEEIDEEFDTIN